MPLDLKNIPEPSLDIQFADGQTKSYPLFDLYEKLESEINKTRENPTTTAQSDAIRAALDLGDYKLSSYHCHHIYAEVMAKVKDLEVSKKISALTRN